MAVLSARVLRVRRRQQHTGKAACSPYFRIPYFGCAALIVKIRRHDADDKVNVVVETQGSAEDVRVGAEVPLPKSVADHRFEVEARRWIVGMEGAAQFGLHVEQGKIIRRDRLELDASGLRRAREIDGPASLWRYVLEDSRTLKVLPLRHGQANVVRTEPRKSSWMRTSCSGAG